MKETSVYKPVFSSTRMNAYTSKAFTVNIFLKICVDFHYVISVCMFLSIFVSMMIRPFDLLVAGISSFQKLDLGPENELVLTAQPCLWDYQYLKYFIFHLDVKK